MFKFGFEFRFGFGLAPRRGVLILGEADGGGVNIPRLVLPACGGSRDPWKGICSKILVNFGVIRPGVNLPGYNGVLLPGVGGFVVEDSL